MSPLEERIQRNREYLRDYLSHQGCQDCGCTEDIHLVYREGSSSRNLARFASKGRSMAFILNEIPKCDVLCRACSLDWLRIRKCRPQ